MSDAGTYQWFAFPGIVAIPASGTCLGVSSWACAREMNERSDSSKRRRASDERSRFQEIASAFVRALCPHRLRVACSCPCSLVKQPGSLLVVFGNTASGRLDNTTIRRSIWGRDSSSPWAELSHLLWHIVVCYRPGCGRSRGQRQRRQDAMVITGQGMRARALCERRLALKWPN